MSDDIFVRLEDADVRIELMARGATIHRFEVRLPDGTWRNIVLGWATPDEYAGLQRYLGATVGRFANRIADGRFAIDGVRYIVDVNEPPNQLHGGTGGWDSRDWDVLDSGTGWVEFGLESADGDQGYPGRVFASARYELVPGGAQVTYRATTDAPTVINMTTHPYFNLAGEASGNTDDHVLTVHASRYTPNRPDGIPTGEIRDVTGSGADFRQGRRFVDARLQADAEGITRKGGFDHNFVIDGEGMREHCRLTGPDGLTLAIESDRPGLQVYGGEHFDGTQVGISGVPYVQRAGIALETQDFPDAPNHDNFPSTVLRPGEVYTTTTRWQITRPA